MKKVALRVGVSHEGLRFYELHNSAVPLATEKVFDFMMQTQTNDVGSIKQLQRLWFERRSISPNQRRGGDQYRQLVSLYYEMCTLDSRQTWRRGRLSAKQLITYMLARLQPALAPINANRVIKASALGKRQFKHAVDTVEELLNKDKEHGISSAEFRRISDAEIAPASLERPLHTDEESHRTVHLDARQKRHTYAGVIRVLANAARLDLKAGALDLPRAHEQLLGFRRTARRVNKAPVLASVIDVFSAEARAAFNMCYSAFWEEFLRARYRVDQNRPFQIYHRLWHLELHWPDPQDQRRAFTLFSGNCLALHPVGAIMMASPTARDAIGVVLAINDDTPPDLADRTSRRFFYALNVAVITYTDIHQENLGDRRQQSANRRDAYDSRPSKRRKGTRYIDMDKNDSRR